MSPEEVQKLAPTLFFILFLLVALNTLVFFGYFLQNKNKSSFKKALRLLGRAVHFSFDCPFVPEGKPSHECAF